MAIRRPTNYDATADIIADLEDMADSIQDELDLKVDKVQGKGLSTNDYSTSEKEKLAGVETGAEVNAIETVKVNGTALTPSSKAVDVPVPTKTSDLSNDSGFIDKDVNDLTNYYKKTEVDSKISSVYKYKGTVSTYGDLPSTDLTIGDVYNIETADSTHGIKAGDNVAWNGTAWDVLAGTVDLSGKEDKSNKVTSIDENSTNTQYPSAKLLYDKLLEKQEEINTLEEKGKKLENQIPTKEVTGTDITISDSSDLELKDAQLKGNTSQGENPSPENPQDIHVVTGENSINIENEDGTSEQNYPVNVGSIELCKIGDYQDKIYKSAGKWYLEKKVEKVVLDGSEDSWYENAGTRGAFQVNISNVFYDISQITVLSNYFQATSGTYIFNTGIDNKISAFSNNRIYVRYSIYANNLAGFKTWLSTHDTTVYYVLAEPTTVEITDTTLISQLEALINMETYKKITHINTAGADLAPIADVIYYQDLSTIINELQQAVLNS